MFPNKCLDIEAGLVSMGTKIVLMDKNGSNHQKWDFDRATGRIFSRFNPDMIISRSVRKSDRNNIKGTPVYLGNRNSPNTFQEEWKWNLADVPQPSAVIKLSYKIFVNPVNGALPTSNMIANIHKTIQQINNVCVRLNTSFRFELLEEPVLIGGPMPVDRLIFGLRRGYKATTWHLLKKALKYFLKTVT